MSQYNEYNEEEVRQAITLFLAGVGEDPNREGLQGTPDRVARAWREMLQGYNQEPAEVLKTHKGEDGFTDINGYDQMVVLSDVPFYSTCEHHLLPFSGIADIGYLPGDSGLVVGLSKLARIVDTFARRLQVQERLTGQIADALQEHLKPMGVAVRLRARHECMSCRGVNKGGTMATEALVGAFRDHAVRAEFWSLCQPLSRGVK
jgi:GTP cyclohydrolase IA